MYRSKAPLRLGLAGGGTDVNPYAASFGGAVLNATINLYAHATIQLLQEQIIVLNDLDADAEKRFEWSTRLPVDAPFSLMAGVYNHMQKDFGLPATGFSLSTSVDVPIGSGLGTSSTLVVAIIGAFAEMLQLTLSKYDIAKLAYEIERNDLRFAGGHQDQYAASFGGINFMEFTHGDKVAVHPLQIKNEVLLEFENNMVLYYTGQARQSGKIIEAQQANVIGNLTSSVEAMHQLKTQALHMKQALLKGRLQDIGELFDFGFEQKRKMADGISNAHIEEIYAAAKAAGATGGKISGAGGGGFMFFYCPGNARFKVIETLNSFAGKIWNFNFTNEGLTTWSI
jgi:D-glycero-alpha-D-manno-heptose-7-phosphate kinase